MWGLYARIAFCPTQPERPVGTRSPRPREAMQRNVSFDLKALKQFNQQLIGTDLREFPWLLMENALQIARNSVGEWSEQRRVEVWIG